MYDHGLKSQDWSALELQIAWRCLRADYKTADRAIRTQKDLLTSSKPWTTGHEDYCRGFVRRVMSDPRLCELFRLNQELPRGYETWLLKKLLVILRSLRSSGAILGQRKSRKQCIKAEQNWLAKETLSAKYIRNILEECHSYDSALWSS